jgi:dihydrolipoamide dehydrogenase
MAIQESPKQNAQYDVIIIGAGPAGYSSAIRCAQLGLKTVCVDNWRNKPGQRVLGGVHLGSGCVAALTLLESAKLYRTLLDETSKQGIHADNISIDIAAVVRYKDQVIDALGHKISGTFSEQQVDRIHATGKLLNSKKVEITPIDGSSAYLIEAKHIILATGSTPVSQAYAKTDNESIIDCFAALNLDSLPKKLAIIGASVNGLELAAIWSRFGAETILLDAQENFLSLLDHQISLEAYRIYTAQGLDLRLGARVTSAKKIRGKVTVEYQDEEGAKTLRVDKLIVATGRKPNTDNIAAPEANLLLDENGFVNVDDNCRTNLPGVYAIGDLNLLGPMLAHKGIEEGVFVAEQIAGRQSSIDYSILPSVIYTEPEIAWVGQTEQALRAKGVAIKVGVFPLGATARSQALGKTEGLVKIIADADTDALLGVHIIGPHASELIAEAVLAMGFSASGEDLARTIHAHPTLSEGFHEAALAFKVLAPHQPL